ncbi:MAG TPA: branched-chain amino acid ABC transporter ATP-binding protein, partial [Microcoleaceae bacterium UBA11344]|nr:branched-chain amino acid ABC transporter ATP-binding protein [Microcoleaceae cyanobacterium UBA11344]
QASTAPTSVGIVEKMAHKLEQFIKG